MLVFFTFPECAGGEERFRVVFYNVENLFDTVKEPGKNDNDFLPDSKRYWNKKKYYAKLNALSKVVSAFGEWEAPALIGMCEVENERTLNDLLKQTPLKKQSYRYVMTDCDDQRGIDVALLYQRDQFRLLGYTAYKVRFRSPRKVSRDILHVYGSIKNNDTLDVFVCHYPSRRGGQKASEPDRMRVSEVLRQKIDSLLAVRKKASVIVMGDFNDEPSNKSIRETLDARPVEEMSVETLARRKRRLYNLASSLEKENNRGTYKYQGKWNVFDQLIVSGNLLEKTNRFYVKQPNGRVFDAAFLLVEDKTHGGKRPKRTFYGMKYEGGFSDHLPIYADFYLSLTDK